MRQIEMAYLFLFILKNLNAGFDISTRQPAIASGNVIWWVRIESHSPTSEYEIGFGQIWGVRIKETRQILIYTCVFISYISVLNIFLYMNIDLNFSRAFGACNKGKYMATLYFNLYLRTFKMLTNWPEILEIECNKT